MTTARRTSSTPAQIAAALARPGRAGLTEQQATVHPDGTIGVRAGSTQLDTGDERL